MGSIMLLCFVASVGYSGLSDGTVGGRRRAHVEHEFRKLRSANSVAVTLRSTGDWYEADPESTLFRIAERAVAAEWGQLPLFVREGGTMPVRPALPPCPPAHRPTRPPRGLPRNLAPAQEFAATHICPERPCAWAISVA